MSSFAAVSIADSVQQAIDAIFAFLPNLVGFLLILFVGWIIAKVLGGLVRKGLQRVGADGAAQRSPMGRHLDRVGTVPSRLAGGLVFWLVFLLALTAAIAALSIPSLTGFMNDVQNYLPNAIAAAIVLVATIVLAGAAGGFVGKVMGDSPAARMARTVVPGLILAIGTFMVLDQLQIAPVIVTITYAALIGMLALAGALAFGLGGREVARDMLQGAVGDARQQGRAARPSHERTTRADSGRFDDPTRTTEAPSPTGRRDAER